MSSCFACVWTLRWLHTRFEIAADLSVKLLSPSFVDVAGPSPCTLLCGELGASRYLGENGELQTDNCIFCYSNACKVHLLSRNLSESSLVCGDTTGVTPQGSLFGGGTTPKADLREI
uniref:1-phosphatidylinositol 4,5-bisphosphate phosphodiesterase beta-4 n=1 Tax=Schistocephalus solidus TaxID=70667 RepID=A0A0X3P5P8_SCHSO